MIAAIVWEEPQSVAESPTSSSSELPDSPRAWPPVDAKAWWWDDREAPK